jgi:tRNA nucleotidyltransferase (CCA-adding enzyme)
LQAYIKVAENLQKIRNLSQEKYNLNLFKNRLFSIIMEFLEDIKKELRPNTSLLKEIDEFINSINKGLRRKKIKAVCIPGGSVAKGTFLKGDFDVDLFVKFDYSYKDKNISEILESALEKFDYELIHGSRDYFQVKDSLKYEIVPVLDVKDPSLAPNVTDMSPMHVDWVKKRLKKDQDDEIRLTKKFCKAAGVYGAESYIRGFSGHVIDILVIHYGSFLKLLEASSKWKPQKIIDVENHYNSPRDIVFSMNQSKITGPLIVVDPILRTRNAASAVSHEKFILLRKRAARFLKSPSEAFFREEKITKSYLKKKFKSNLVILTLKADEGKKDVVGTKILKAFKFLKSGLKEKGFELKDSGWSWNNNVLFWFVFSQTSLPEKKTVRGPPVQMSDNARQFKDKHEKTFVKDGYVFADISIRIRDALENVKALVNEPYFKERVEIVSLETEKYK